MITRPPAHHAAQESALRPAAAASPAPVVLVPRGGRWGHRVADRLTARGARPWIVPLICTELAAGPELDTARADLAAGAHDWVAVTSAAAVPALPATVRARIATVGPATASALREAGYAVEMVPHGPDFSAAAMLAAWHPTGRVLLLRSDLAAPTLAAGLRATGARVTDVVAYRTAATEPTGEESSGLRTGRADAALVTSGSVARALAGTGVAGTTLVACLGPRTAQVARECGLRVDLVASSQHIDTLVDELADVLCTDRMARPGQHAPDAATRPTPEPEED